MKSKDPNENKIICYKEEYKKNPDSNKKVSLLTYRKIIKAYSLFLMNKVYEGHKIQFPAGLGNFFVCGRKLDYSKVDMLAINWKATLKLWEEDEDSKKEKTLVRYMNFDTDGIRYRFSWQKKYTRVPFNKVYSLRIPSTNKKLLAQHIRAGTQYPVIR